MRVGMRAWVWVAVALSMPAGLGAQGASVAEGPAGANSAAAEGVWREHVEAWRAQRQRELTAENGWLTLVALDWLKPGVNLVGSGRDCQIQVEGAPEHLGRLTVAGKTVQLLTAPGGFPAGLTVDGEPAREGPLSADELHPSTLAWQGLTMVVLPRGGRFALRVKNAHAPARTAFRGLHWYEPDLRYTVEARWTPSRPPKMLKIPTVIGTTLNLPSPGVAEFTLGGRKLRLEPVLEDPHDNSLFFILRDATSKTTTYEAGRFLRTGFPDHGLDQPGTLILDFNQLYNPPCAYTPYATCPLPPEQNRLPVAIEAGEERYRP